MLLGLLRCGLCGKRMKIDTSQRYSNDRAKKDYYYYYTCAGHTRHETVNRCTHSKRYPVNAFESEIIEYLRDILAAQTPLDIEDKSDFDLIKASQIKKYEEELVRAKSCISCWCF